MAEGRFSWQDVNGRQVFVHNRVLVLDGLRHRPHPTHFTIAQAIDAIELHRNIFVEINALMTALHEPSQLPIADANQQHVTPASWFAHHDGFHFV